MNSQISEIFAVQHGTILVCALSATVDPDIKDIPFDELDLFYYLTFCKHKAMTNTNKVKERDFYSPTFTNKI